ncbi:MAG: class I SAM-dependent methyltransferase, partial [Candidatus Binataceae bacterium]
MSLANTKDVCLGCGAGLPPAFLDLGRMPLANSYLKPERVNDPEPAFRLALAYCPHCHLVQLTERVPPAQLFSEYTYFSSYSDSFAQHAREMAETLIGRFSLGPQSRILEIASNDGYLLRHFRERGFEVLGVEPARNIAAVAIERGIPTLECFFNSAAVPAILDRLGPADMIIGNNVLAHVPSINDFMSAAAAVMKPEGLAVFEFPYLGELLDRGEFDTIYHEHVFYYSLSAIAKLAAHAGMELFDAEFHEVHGGSLRIFLQRRGVRAPNASVARMLANEKARGLLSASHYESFGLTVDRIKVALLNLLRELKASGKRVAAYGAPAKGNTLANYCGIDGSLIEFTVDRSPHKQGLLLPGSHLPILAPEELLRRQPDYALILPWNIADEIVQQQHEYLKAGGQFIVPVPQP